MVMVVEQTRLHLLCEWFSIWLLALSVPGHVYIHEKTCTGYQLTYIYVLNKNPCVWSWEPNQPAIFLLLGFFGNKVIVQVFRGLDQLSGISGAEIMAQKQKIRCKFKSHKRFHELQCVSTTTKMKVANVRAEPTTIGTADVNTATIVPFEQQTQRFIRTTSCEVVL